MLAFQILGQEFVDAGRRELLLVFRLGLLGHHPLDIFAGGQVVVDGDLADLQAIFHDVRDFSLGQNH